MFVAYYYYLLLLLFIICHNFLTVFILILLYSLIQQVKFLWFFEASNEVFFVSYNEFLYLLSIYLYALPLSLIFS